MGFNYPPTKASDYLRRSEAIEVSDPEMIPEFHKGTLPTPAEIVEFNEASFKAWLGLEGPHGNRND